MSSSVYSFIARTQKSELRSAIMQFDSWLTQLQYVVPYETTLRYLDSGWRVLDWGCGNGHFAYFLMSHGIVTTGFSFEPPPEILHAQRNFTFAGGSPEEPRRLPFDDAAFDAVFSVGVLEHVHETGGTEAESLTEISRVLKSGGLFFCFHFPNKYQWIEAVGRAFGIIGHFHARKYSRRDIALLMSGAGLEIVNSGRYNFFPRNQLARLPGILKNGRFAVALFQGLDRLMAAVFPFLCTNHYFVARRSTDQVSS